MHLPEERKPEHGQMGSPAVSSRSGGDVYGCALNTMNGEDFFWAEGGGALGMGCWRSLSLLK